MKLRLRDFSAHPVVKALSSQCRDEGRGSTYGQRTRSHRLQLKDPMSCN